MPFRQAGGFTVEHLRAKLEAIRAGHYGHMPRYVKPVLPDRVELAIEIFGNRLRLAIIAHLADHAGSDIETMAEALGSKPGTIHFQLQGLEARGVVYSDPPAGQRNGRRALYWRDEDAVRNLYRELGDWIHIREP